MEDALLLSILRDAKTIAVVGLSDKQDRPSFGVAEYLLDAGYDIIPVNPMITGWNGRKSYSSLAAIPDEIVIDIVDVFRKSEDAPPVVRGALARSPPPKIVWLQEGVESDEGKAIVDEFSARGGRTVFFSQNKCLKKELARLSP